MPQRGPSKQAAPAELLSQLNLGYNNYTDPTLTSPKMWAAAINVYSGAFGNIQRSRFANVVTPSPTTGLPFTSLKYFALPTASSYLLADINGKLYSYDTGSSYAQTQRLNPYVDPSGAGSSQLNGPWSRETLQNIVYEMNGQVKQAGRLANAATIEGFGLDAPDASPQVVLSSGATQTISAISRSNGVVSATLSSALTVPGGNGIGLINVTGVTDAAYNGTFVLVSGSGSTALTWTQFGQNNSSSGGSVNTNILKSIGRSYQWAWENANKFHVGAPSPATQFIAYNNQNGVVQLIEPGTVTTNGTATVTGTGTFFTSAWIGRSLWIATLGSVGRIIAVPNGTQLTLANAAAPASGQVFQVYDPQSTHIRLYETGDGQATYFRVQRNAFVPGNGTLVTAGLQFFDNGTSEPPAFPYTTETSQVNNLPPPVGKFLNEYQGRLAVFGVAGADQSFFYSNVEATTIGQQQESFAPLNQVTLPIQNAKLNGMVELPGSAILWSDKQDMFRLTGLLTDNLIGATAPAQGAQIARLPYALGCASPFATAITPLGAIWLTSNAEVWLFTDRYAPRNIGRPVQDILSTIVPSSLSLARMAYYHTTIRNWLVLSVPANSSTFNNTVLVLDLDLLASNGSPSYFTFDMATNSPSWWVFQPGTSIAGNWTPRCDSVETVYEAGGIVRLMVGQTDLIQDIDYLMGGFGTEISVPNGTLTTHAFGNESPFLIKRPTFVRWNTNRDPAMLALDGWKFQVQGIDDDFYTFFNPLTLAMTPGTNDTSALGGNPDFTTGLAFRHSPELFRIAGVNFVMGRRLRFTVNFPSGTGTNYQLRSIQIGFGANPPN